MANKFYHAAQEFKQNAKYPKTAEQKAKAKAKRKEGWTQMKKGFKESLVDATIEGGKMLGKYATGGMLFKDSGAISTVKKGLQGAADIAIGLGKVIFNHPDWYLHGGYQNLIGANFAIKKGIPSQQQLYYRVDDPENEDVLYRAVSAPNVMAYETYPTKPINDQGGWNLGIQRLYNMLRAANAGARNYTLSDLEAYVITQRSILIFLHTVRRIIGTFNQFAYFDVQVPKQLLSAMGVADGQPDLIPSLINAYNRACAWFSAKFPLKLTIHERDAWLYNNIFCDSDDAKCNYHLFSPSYHILPYYNNDSEMANFGMDFSCTGIPGANYSLTMLISDVDMLPELSYNGLFDVIAGDVIKAWGTESIYSLVQIDNTYRTPVIYDEFALAQIQNTDILGEVIISGLNLGDNTFTTSRTTFDMALTIGDNDLWSESFSLSTAINQIKKWINPEFKTSVLNSPTDIQEPGRILSYTRLKATLNKNGDGAPYVSACGTEFVGMMHTFFTMSKYDDNFDTAYEFYHLPMGKFNFAAVIMPNTVPTPDEFEHRLFGTSILRFAWSNLDYAPKVHFGVLKFSTEYDEWTDSISETLFDFNNYAILDEELIKTYHGIADQSVIYTTVTAKLAGDYQELKF